MDAVSRLPRLAVYCGLGPVEHLYRPKGAEGRGASRRMRIITFNVNGLRARIKAGWPSKEFLEKYDPDIICLQEVRAKPEQIPASFLPGYKRYPSVHSKAGYAGAWTFVKADLEQPLLAMDEFPVAGFNEKGRASILDFKYFKLVNSYSPNSGSRLEKIQARKAYEQAMYLYIKESQEFKPVVLCGDLNVAPGPDDCNISVQAGVSPAERAAMNQYEMLNMIDAWKWLHANQPVQFTFFSNMYDARACNKGMRLDHFRLDPGRVNLKECEILHDWAAGSDHTPVLLEFYIGG